MEPECGNMLAPGWVVITYIVIPLRGSILQAGTCQIISFAENPRWSRSVATLTRNILLIVFMKHFLLLYSNLPDMAPHLSTTKPSPLTNSKVLTAFKQTRSDKLKIEAINSLGTKYLKKETSIRFLKDFI